MVAYRQLAAMTLIGFALCYGNAEARLKHYPHPAATATYTDSLSQDGWYSPNEQQFYAVLQRLFGKEVYANLLANQHFLYLQEWLSAYAYQQRH